MIKVYELNKGFSYRKISTGELAIVEMIHEVKAAGKVVRWVHILISSGEALRVEREQFRREYSV